MAFMSFGRPAPRRCDLEREALQKPRLSRHYGAGVWECRSKFVTGWGCGETAAEGMERAYRNWKLGAKRRDDYAERDLEQAPGDV